MHPPRQARNACIRAKLHVELFERAMPESGNERAGEATTIVLCHGFGGSARNFRAQARTFEQRARVVLFDMRGHARSEKPLAAEAYSLDCLVGDLAEVIDTHGIGKLLVGGLSLGACVALAYARLHPERVAGLMLAAYPAEPSELGPWARKFAEEIEEFGLELAGARWVWGADSRFDPQARHLIKLGFMEHAPWALAAMLRHALGELEAVEAQSEALRMVQVPTRIVVGGDDTGSLGPCRQLSRLIPHARLSVFEGAGHVLNLVRPTEFNEELAMLLEEVAT